MEAGIPEMQVEELKRRLDAGDDLFVLDVREPHEYQICNINGHLIPLGDLPKRVSELDSSREIVAHCRSGVRSGKAVGLPATGRIQESAQSRRRNPGLGGSRRSQDAEVLKTGFSTGLEQPADRESKRGELKTLPSLLSPRSTLLAVAAGAVLHRAVSWPIASASLSSRRSEFQPATCCHHHWFSPRRNCRLVVYSVDQAWRELWLQPSCLA